MYDYKQISAKRILEICAGFEGGGGARICARFEGGCPDFRERFSKIELDQWIPIVIQTKQCFPNDGPN